MLPTWTSVIILDWTVFRVKAYRLIIRDVVWDFGTVHSVSKGVLLEPGLRRIGDCPGA
jgi:hypothetical protein